MRSKINKVLSIIFTLALLMMSAMTTYVYAEGESLLHKPNPTPPTGIEGFVKPVATLFQVGGTAVAAGMLLYVGIKYVMASANEKADLKNASIKYVVGAIILFSSVNLFGIVEKLMMEIGGTPSATTP